LVFHDDIQDAEYPAVFFGHIHDLGGREMTFGVDLSLYTRLYDALGVGAVVAFVVEVERIVHHFSDDRQVVDRNSPDDNHSKNSFVCRSGLACERLGFAYQ